VGVVGVFLGASTIKKNVRFASSACAPPVVARDVHGIYAPGILPLCPWRGGGGGVGMRPAGAGDRKLPGPSTGSSARWRQRTLAPKSSSAQREASTASLTPPLLPSVWLRDKGILRREWGVATWQDQVRGAAAAHHPLRAASSFAVPGWKGAAGR
jgi:hypothetical protein